MNPTLKGYDRVKAIRIERDKADQCIECGKPRDTSYGKRCEACRSVTAAEGKHRYREARDKGLCARCRVKVEPDAKGVVRSLCPVHLPMANIDSKARAARIRQERNAT